MNPKTARDAFDAGTKADDAPDIKIGIRGVYSKGGPDFHESYFDITIGDNTFSIDNGEGYDSYEKRCHFKIYESSLRNGLSGIFGENKIVIDALYNRVLNSIRDHITNDLAYKAKYGPNGGTLFIISIDFEQKLLQRLQRRKGILDEKPDDSAGGLPHHKI